MENVVIGSHTCTLDPMRMTMVREDKACAHVQTYDSVAYFSWGTTLVGKEILLEWPVMDAAEFAALDAIFQADASFTFNPNDGVTTDTFTVEMTSFTGDYWRGRGTTTHETRKNVKMTLLILAVVTP